MKWKCSVWQHMQTFPIHLCSPLKLPSFIKINCKLTFRSTFHPINKLWFEPSPVLHFHKENIHFYFCFMWPVQCKPNCRSTGVCVIPVIVCFTVIQLEQCIKPISIQLLLCTRMVCKRFWNDASAASISLVFLASRLEKESGCYSHSILRAHTHTHTHTQSISEAHSLSAWVRACS